MHGRTKSVPALESYDGNWVISNSSRNDQTIYSVPKSVELKKPRNGEYEYNLHSTGERSNGGGERSRIIKESRTGGYGVNQQTTRRLNKNRYNRHRSADRLHDDYTLTTTDGHHARSLALSRDSAFEGQRRPRQVVLRKSDGDFGFTMRQIPSALYGRKSESSFVPTPAVPALQRLNIVEPGSLAYKAGLRPRDFILEINGEYVARSSHLDVVHLIKNSGKTLTIKVIEGAKDNENERHQQQHSNTSPRNRHRVRYADKTDANNNKISRSRDRENGAETLQRGRHRTTVDTGSPVPSSSRGGFSQPDPSVASSTTSNRTLQRPSTVANIRLSRTAANDQVFYVSNDERRGGRTGSPHSSASTLRPATNGGRRVSSPPPLSTPRMASSSSSLASIKSHPTAHRKRYQKTSSSTSGDVTTRGLRHHRDVIHEVQNEAGPTPTGNDEDLQSVSELKLDDVAYTYDVIRPRDVPFETDEGYIGLQEKKVDYVDETTKQEAEKINFLEIAERVRQLYLRSKSTSQAQQ